MKYKEISAQLAYSRGVTDAEVSYAPLPMQLSDSEGTEIDLSWQANQVMMDLDALFSNCYDLERYMLDFILPDWNVDVDINLLHYRSNEYELDMLFSDIHHWEDGTLLSFDFREFSPFSHVRVPPFRWRMVKGA